MVAVVYHLLGHTAVDAYILACDEASLVAAKEQYHIGYVQRVAYAPCRLLNGVGSLVNGVGSVNPSGLNGIYSCFACKAHCQGVCQRGNAAFGCRVALGLWLAHSVARRGYVYNGCSLCQMLL